jgi:DNA-binding LacI/PurR family transcriptional regulator
MPKYTIRDVARESGVGVGTVSRVLNNSPLVSEETRQRIQSAIDRLGFQPSPMARGLSLGKALTVGIVVPFLTRPVFVGRLEGIEAALARSTYDLVLYSATTPDQCAALFDRIAQERRVGGLLILAFHPNDKQVEQFNNAGLPVVLLDTEHPELVSITIDDEDGGRQATQYLANLGHKRIAFVGDLLDSPFGWRSTARRLEGYRSVLAEQSIPFRGDYHKQGEHGRYTAHRLTQELFALSDPPTAIFAASDTQALGVIEALRQMGLQVPEDVSVVGYDDIEAASYIGLTTIHQPLYQSGEEAVAALLQLIDPVDQSLPTSYTLPVRLVIRQTAARPSR